jgi:hypothetical protein
MHAACGQLSCQQGEIKRVQMHAVSAIFGMGLQPGVAIASNLQWTCSVIVDGQLSCQQGERQSMCVRSMLHTYWHGCKLHLLVGLV